MSKIPQIKEYEGYPVVTAEKMKYLDLKASTEYGVPQIALMENAGKGISLEILRIIKEELSLETGNSGIIVCAGRGNNGGDGLVTARYLKQAGARVEIFIIPPREGAYGELVNENLQKAKENGIRIETVSRENVEGLLEIFSKADVLIDALLGAGSIGKPSGPVKRVIQLMNKSAKPIAAVDIPSGLSPDTGHHSGVFIMAKWTFTLGFPKSGLMAPHALKNVGKLKIIDIGYPAQLVEEAKQQ